MQPRPNPHFPILESFVDGVRLAVENGRIFLLLSFFPFALTLATAVAMRVFENKITLFLMPVVQLPSSLIIGLECALILRYLLLGEYPVPPSTEGRAGRSRAVTQSAIVYATVNYFITGAYVFILKLQSMLVNNPDAARPYMPVFLVLIVGGLWATRWLWLHIPPALNWPASALFARVGRWRGSLSIFALFALCSMSANLVLAIARTLIHALFGKVSAGLAAAFDDASIAAMSIVLAIVFTCASAEALQHLTGQKNRQGFNEEDPQ